MIIFRFIDWILRYRLWMIWRILLFTFDLRFPKQTDFKNRYYKYFVTITPRNNCYYNIKLSIDYRQMFFIPRSFYYSLEIYKRAIDIAITKKYIRP